MFDSLRQLFDTSDFPARWRCGQWSQVHGWVHIVSDALIFGAYAAIPTAIAFVTLRRKQDITFPKLYWLFAAFIFSCGLGHLIEASIFWHPWYRLSGAVKVVTAVVSWATVLALLQHIPMALTLPGSVRLDAELQREVVERRRVEAELRRLNADYALRLQELQTLLDVLPIGIGIANDPQCRDIRTNRAFSELLGITHGSNASLSALPSEAPGSFKVWCEGRELVPEELPIQRAAREGVEIRDFEEEVVCSDGRHLDLLCHAAPLQDAHGTRCGAVGVFIDITERKRAEDRLRLVVEASPNALLMVAADGRITLVNSQAERLFDYTREELLNQPVEVLLPDRLRAQHPQMRAGFFAAPSARPMGAGRDLRGRRKDGSEMPIEIGLNPLITGEGAFVLASIIDITERKAAEEQLKASLKEKQVLLHEIHHRVKNNLQFISSLLRLQAADLHDERFSEVFEETRGRVHAMALVHEKLYRAVDFAQLDYGAYLHELVTTVARTFSSRVATVNFSIEADAAELETSAAVPVGLIVNELVSNSLKHAFPAGRAGTVIVRLHGARESGYQLTVRDDGVGLRGDFEPATTRSMGWRLVEMLVRQLDGRVDVRREGGTEFNIHFQARTTH